MKPILGLDFKLVPGCKLKNNILELKLLHSFFILFLFLWTVMCLISFMLHHKRITASTSISMMFFLTWHDCRGYLWLINNILQQRSVPITLQWNWSIGVPTYWNEFPIVEKKWKDWYKLLKNELSLLKLKHVRNYQNCCRQNRWDLQGKRKKNPQLCKCYCWTKVQKAIVPKDLPTPQMAYCNKFKTMQNNVTLRGPAHHGPSKPILYALQTNVSSGNYSEFSDRRTWFFHVRCRACSDSAIYISKEEKGNSYIFFTFLKVAWIFMIWLKFSLCRKDLDPLSRHMPSKINESLIIQKKAQNAQQRSFKFV